jgi:hypothetical protein
MAAPPRAQAQRRPPKRTPPAAVPSTDTTSGGAPTTPAAKLKVVGKPAIPQGTYQVRSLNNLRTRRLRLRADGTPDFVNINKIAFYEDKKALRAIAKAERRRNYREARSLLERYVAQFGIQNFYRNTNLLWRLGQLLERDSQMVKAKAFYRLALKHHRTDIRKVQLYYDSLERKSQQLYVPLKMYYDLVEYRKNINTFHPPKGVYTSMGDAMNTKSPDYGPAMAGNDSLILFSSKRKRRGITGVMDEDLYLSRKQGISWSDAEPLPKPINSPNNEGSACLSKDGRTIFFARCECATCHGNCDLFTATKGKDGKWSAPKSLGSAVNSPAWDSQPTCRKTRTHCTSLRPVGGLACPTFTTPIS